MAHPAAFGPYQVSCPLGQGGMGRVYEVTHPDLPGRRLALKQLLGDGADAHLLARFLREARLLARVDHPNVVRVHACEETSPHGPFMVMDLVEGTSLEQLRREGPLEPRQAAELVADLAGALGAVHAAGVLHRDLKPENVVLRPDGSPVLLDFGVARAGDAERLTHTGAVVGSPHYMAPEQAEGVSSGQLDERADVFGLGAVLYALLTGQPPHHDAGSMITLLKRVLTQPARWPDPAELGGRVLPRGLVAVATRAMALERERRYRSARELEAALRAWLRGEDPEPSRRRGLGAALGAVLALGGLVGAALALRPTPPVTPEPPIAASRRPERPARPQPPPDARESRRDWTSLAQSAGPGQVGGGFFAGGSKLLCWPLAEEAALVEWSLEGDGPPHPTGRRWSSPGVVTQVALAPAGRAVLLCGRELWQLDLRGAEAALERLQPEWLTEGPSLDSLLAVSPRGDRFGLGVNRAGVEPLAFLCAWEAHGARELQRFTLSGDPRIRSLAVDGATRLAAGGASVPGTGPNLIRLFDGSEGRVEAQTLCEISALAFDPVGGLWLGNTDWRIHPVELETGFLAPNLAGVGAQQQIAKERGVAAGDRVGLPTTHNGQVNQLRFAPDDWSLPGRPRWLISGSWHPSPRDEADQREHGPGEVRVWSPGADGTWENVGGIGNWPRPILSLDVTPDGEWVLVGHGGELELWRREAIPRLAPADTRLPDWKEVTARLERPR